MKSKPNIILHIPHSSTAIPFKDGFIADENELRNELKLLSDWFTDELFDLPYPKVIAPFSRLFCDVERFPDDESEIMSQFGMGMCYTSLDNGKLMRNVSPELRNRIKSEYYDPHHKRLEDLTDEMLASYGTTLIIDCHSFEDLPNNRYLVKEIPRPDFCIVTIDYHTPEIKTKNIREYLINNGFSVEMNKPYSETLIPMKYYKKDKNIHGIMIEVNRKLYMTKILNEVCRNKEFLKIKSIIKDVVIELNKI
jgi:N-formylglutamate amidohydrolase